MAMLPSYKHSAAADGVDVDTASHKWKMRVEMLKRCSAGAEQTGASENPDVADRPPNPTSGDISAHFRYRVYSFGAPVTECCRGCRRLRYPSSYGIDSLARTWHFDG